MVYTEIFQRWMGWLSAGIYMVVFYDIYRVCGYWYRPWKHLTVEDCGIYRCKLFHISIVLEKNLYSGAPYTTVRIGLMLMRRFQKIT